MMRKRLCQTVQTRGEEARHVPFISGDHESSSYRRLHFSRYKAQRRRRRSLKRWTTWRRRRRRALVAGHMGGLAGPFRRRKKLIDKLAPHQTTGYPENRSSHNSVCAVEFTTNWEKKILTGSILLFFYLKKRWINSGIVTKDFEWCPTFFLNGAALALFQSYLTIKFNERENSLQGISSWIRDPLN